MFEPFINGVADLMGTTQATAGVFMSTVFIGFAVVIIAIMKGGYLGCGLVGTSLLAMFTLGGWVPTWIGIILVLLVSALLARELSGRAG